jgi:hypothetical protein
MTHKSIVICVFAGLLAGCSSVSVVKNPGPEDTGIRFNRPKPYLLVTPADATGRMVKLKIEYLPDYSEEYSVHPKGKKPPQVQLQDGWNLVAVGGPAPPPKPEEAPPPASPVDPMKVPEYVVAAGNVPIGLYEAVFDTGCGRKYLKGWRYIGFTVMGGGSPIGIDANCTGGPDGPAQGCRPGMAGQGDPRATDAPGGECRPGMAGQAGGSVSSIPGPLYGLVFFNGVMTFRQLDEIANNMTCPQYLRPIPQPVAPPAPPRGPEIRGGEQPPRGPEIRGGEQQKPGTSTSPSTPTPNPPGGAAWKTEPPSPAHSGDGKVARATGNVKIPPPRIWDTAK